MFLTRPRWLDSDMTFNMCSARPLAIVRAFPFFDLTSYALPFYLFCQQQTCFRKEMFRCHSFAVPSFKLWNHWTQVPSHIRCCVCLLMQAMRPAVSKLFIIFLVFHKQIIIMVLLTVKTQEFLISRVLAMWPVLTPKAKECRNKTKIYGEKTTRSFQKFNITSQISFGVSNF